MVECENKPKLGDFCPFLLTPCFMIDVEADWYKNRNLFFYTTECCCGSKVTIKDNLREHHEEDQTVKRTINPLLMCGEEQAEYMEQGWWVSGDTCADYRLGAGESGCDWAEQKTDWGEMNTGTEANIKDGQDKNHKILHKPEYKTQNNINN